MARKKAKYKVEPGNVYAIQMDDGQYSYGVSCVSNEVVFFDLRSKSATLPESIFEHPVAFRVAVAKDELESGSWPVVGKIEISDEYLRPGSYVHKPIGSSQYFIYCDGNSTPAHEDEVRGLETLTVWFTSHIQERLESFFKGKKSKFDIAIRKQLGITF